MSGTLRVVLVVLAVALSSAGCAPAENWVEQPTRWRLVEAGERGRVVVDVLIGSSSCDRFARLEADETADTVTIRAYIEHNAADVPCTTDLGTSLRPISLKNALGRRQLLGCEPDDPGADCSLTGSVLS